MIIFLVGKPCIPTNGDRINLGLWAIVTTNFTLVLTVTLEAVMNFTELHGVCSRGNLNLLNRQPSKYLFTQTSPP